MTKLCLIRHGETNFNKEFRIQGITDNPLNENGKLQAFSTGEFLKSKKISFDVIISSPMIRALETAKIISNVLNYSDEIIVNENLYERNFGSLEGRKITDSVYNYFNNDQIEGLEQDKLLEKRILNQISHIVKVYENKNVLIVVHSHVIKSLLVQFLDNFTYRSTLVNSCINFIEYQNEEYIVKEYNVTNY